MSIVIELLDDEKEETMSYQHTPNWAEQHAEMINAIVFPVRYDIVCSGCGDAMSEVDHKTLIRVGKALLVWDRVNMECENCGQGQEDDEPDINPLDAIAEERYSAWKERKLG